MSKKVTKKLFDCKNSLRLVPRLRSDSLQPKRYSLLSLRLLCSKDYNLVFSSMNHPDKKRKPFICFDYYQTLVEIESPFEHIKGWIVEYIKQNIRGVNPDEFYSRFTKYRAVLSTGQEFKSGIAILVGSLEKSCIKYGVESFSGQFKSFVEELFASPVAYPDAHEVIELLKKYYNVGLITNADNHILNESIRRQGFEFDFIITSEDAQSNKPDEKIFQYAMNQLKTYTEEMIMVGDSQYDDVYGAGKVNIRSIWINRKNEILKEEIKQPWRKVNDLKKILHIITPDICQINHECHSQP